MPSRRLLLFDIDGTLLDTGGAGLAAITAAMRATFAVGHGFPEVDLAGNTDSSIVHSLFRNLDIPDTPENREKFFDCYLAELLTRLRAPDSRGRLLPGVRDLLETIRRETTHVMALLTGNIRRGAFLKVRHYEIGDYFCFGAFGDDHDDRNHLGPLAVERARELHDIAFDPRDVVVIGDTPRDIRCAGAISARAITVATGTYSREQLEAHQPHFVFDHFEDTSAVLKIIDEM